MHEEDREDEDCEIHKGDKLTLALSGLLLLVIFVLLQLDGCSK